MVEIAWFLRWTALWQRLSGVQILVGWYEKDRQVVLLDYIVDLIWYLAINLCPRKRSLAAGSVQTRVTTIYVNALTKKFLRITAKISTLFEREKYLYCKL